MPHSVLIVEDDAATREHLARAIAASAEFAVAATAGSLAAGLAALREHAPQVLIADLGLPDGSGIELIRAAPPHTLSLVLTVFGDEQHAVSAIRAGALGYLLKGDSSPAIVAALRAVIDGGSPISPSIARYLLGAVRGHAPAPADGAPELTPRELDVLRAIVKGFTYEEIGRLLDISQTTVAAHVRKVYRKLAVHSRSEATYEALQHGIVRADE
jgi:DNA-binding NarL/FixJ family response regulator